MKESVAGIAFEPASERAEWRLFVAKRLPGGEMGEKWELPGGKVEEGESRQEALAREIKEELGVRVRVGELLGRTVFTNKGAERALFAYRVSFESLDFVLTEHSAWRWASACDLKTLDLVPSDRRLISVLEENPCGA